MRSLAMQAKMDTWTTWFVVRPAESLKAKTAQWESELKELLLQTNLWMKTRGHRTTWKCDDQIAQVKLLFLTTLKRYSNISEFEVLAGSLTLGVDTFDKWWTIELIDDEDSVEEVEKNLTPSLIAQLQQTGKPLVDEWISDLRERTPFEKSLPSAQI